MAPTHASPIQEMSLEQWAALGEDDPGELVDGYLAEEEVPDLTHETVVAWLVSTLRAWLIPRGGYVFGSEVKYAVASRRGRKPDVTAFAPGRGPLPRHGAVPVPPDIAVEVISPNPRDGKRDRIDKLVDYARFGVRYYWILDPYQRTLEVNDLGPDNRYVHALGASEGVVESVPGCEGLQLDLDALWAEVDRLSSE